MIDDQINTFMASDHFRIRAAELEPEIRADIALGKPVNLAAVPDQLVLGHGARAGRRQRQGRVSCGLVADRHGGEGGRHATVQVQLDGVAVVAAGA